MQRPRKADQAGYLRYVFSWSRELLPVVPGLSWRPLAVHCGVTKLTGAQRVVISGNFT